MVLSPKRTPVAEAASLSRHGLKPIMANSVMATTAQEAELKAKAKASQENQQNNGLEKSYSQANIKKKTVENRTAQSKSYDEITAQESAKNGLEKTEKDKASMVSLPIHVVAKGDSLFALSKRYNIMMRSLERWNKLRSPYILKIGDVLYLADPKSAAKR